MPLSFQAPRLLQEGAELSPPEPLAEDSQTPQALPTPIPADSGLLGVPATQEPPLALRKVPRQASSSLLRPCILGHLPGRDLPRAGT